MVDPDNNPLGDRRSTPGNSKWHIRLIKKRGDGMKGGSTWIHRNLTSITAGSFGL